MATGTPRRHLHFCVFFSSRKYILYYRLNLYKYIQQQNKIHFAIWTNTFKGEVLELTTGTQRRHLLGFVSMAQMGQTLLMESLTRYKRPKEILHKCANNLKRSYCISQFRIKESKSPVYALNCGHKMCIRCVSLQTLWTLVTMSLILWGSQVGYGRGDM